MVKNMQLDMKTLITWAAILIGTIAGAVAFLFGTFETTANSSITYSHFDQRLDNLDAKMDTLIKQTK